MSSDETRAAGAADREARAGRWTIEGVAMVDFEDGGCACIATIPDGDDNQDSGVFVRFQSWNETGDRAAHANAALEGKMVRVEITMLDDEG